MAKITDEMKQLLSSQPAYVATATTDGIPSVAPKGTIKVVDDQHIQFAEMAGKRTYDNIKHNPKVAIIAGDMAALKCLRFSGTADLITEGPEFDKGVEELKAMGMPAPQAFVNVTVEEIYDCGSPGFGARVD